MNVHLLWKNKYWFGGDFVAGVPRIYGVWSKGNGQIVKAKRLRSSSVAVLKVAIADFPHTYWGTGCK